MHQSLQFFTEQIDVLIQLSDENVVDSLDCMKSASYLNFCDIKETKR